MAKFDLKEKELQVRGKTCRVREMTHGERMDYIDTMNDVKASARFALSKCCLDPKLTAQEVDELPADVPQQLLTAIMEVSGLGVRPEKKPVASTVVPVSAGAGDGAPSQ